MSTTSARQELLAWARDAGRRTMDPQTGLCLIERDTAWYAISLLASAEAGDRERGNAILSRLPSRDGTHTPATFLAIHHALRDALEPGTADHLGREIQRSLVQAAEPVHRDGNVNHPLGAYCALVLGGELCAAPWAVELGRRRLGEFQRRTGDHRSRLRRQAEMSEYNSLTYTPLTLAFLATIAAYAADGPARDLARFLEERLWVDIAMRYHGPSGQFAGPHSRSYAEDSVGVFSSMHCLMLAAGFDLVVDPALAHRYSHPSTYFQSALTAILPYHVPEEARRIALEKRFPCSVRATTYAESYHENCRRVGPVPPGTLAILAAGHAADAPETPEFAFDDEVYHGGWSELTTYLDRPFALGSALLPYVNAGHADSLMVRIARRPPAGSTQGFRSGFTRGAFNGLIPGTPGLSHSSRTLLDGSFFIEEGRSAIYQHRNRAIVVYAPKRTGHLNLSEYRTDFCWTYPAPFDRLAVNGSPVDTFPAAVPPRGVITFRDGETLGIIIPLAPRPAPENPVLIRREGEFLLVSCWNYRGAPVSHPRDELTAWHTGFYLELHREDALSGEELDRHAAGIAVAEGAGADGVRHVTVRSGSDRMALAYDPFRELVLSRTWNGQEEAVMHLEVESEESGSLSTLFGSELLP